MTTDYQIEKQLEGFFCDLCERKTDEPTYTDLGVVCEICLAGPDFQIPTK